MISETHCDVERVQGIKEGTSQLIFMSLESLLNNRQWRDVLLSQVFTNNLVCIAIDEAHCVQKWWVIWCQNKLIIIGVNSLGETLLERHIVELEKLEALFHQQYMSCMALTATASKSTYDKVYWMLGMCKPVLVYIPPIKNVLYIVKNKTAMDELVENLSNGSVEYH